MIKYSQIKFLRSKDFEIYGLKIAWATYFVKLKLVNSICSGKFLVKFKH